MMSGLRTTGRWRETDSSATPAMNGTGMSETILVVDDEEDIQRLLQRILEREGLRTITAGDAVKGLMLVQDNDVDLVITDVRMPGINGLDFIGQVHDLYPGVPVIVITGFGSIETAVEAIRRGAFFFITKPFDGKTIVEAVRKGLRLPHVIRTATDQAMPARHTFTVTATPGYELVEGVIAHITAVARVLGYDEHTCSVRLPFIVDEIIVRAMKNESTRITVDVILDDERIDFVFDADHRPFDPADLPRSFDDSDITSAAGVGMMVAMFYSDGFTFGDDSGRATVTLLKERRPQE